MFTLLCRLTAPVFVAPVPDALQQAVPHGQDLIPFCIAEGISTLRFPVKGRLAPAAFLAYTVAEAFGQLDHLSMQVQQEVVG